MPLENETPEVNEELAPTPELEETPLAEGDPAPEPEWAPDFSYKVMDEQKEMDEWVRAAVTTPEQENALRELYTKAHGLDSVKGKYESLNGEVEEKWRPLESKYNELNTGLDNLGKLIRDPNYTGRDYRQFFKELNIPNEHVLEYAKNILDYQEMPPEQRAQLDRQRELEHQHQAMSQQQEMYQNQIQELAIQARNQQYNTEFTKPEVGSFIQEFDSKAGKPGSFRQQVLNEGALYYQTHGSEADPATLVRTIVDRFSPFVQVSQQAPAASLPVTPRTVPVIPNVQGTGNSPAKAGITSLADLRAKRLSLRQTV